MVRTARAQGSGARRLLGAALTGYRRNHLARNSSWVIVATGMNGALGLVFWALATHHFTTSAIGGASAVIAAMTFASTAALMGLGTTALQALPQADDETWSVAVNALVVGGTVFGLVAGLLTALLLPLVDNLSIVRQPATLVFIAVGVAALTVATLLDYVFTAERAAHYVVIRGATFGALKLVLLAALVAAGVHSAPLLVLSWVVASLVTTAGTLVWQIHQLDRPHRFGVRGVAHYIRGRLRILLFHHITTLGGVMIPSLMPILVVARLSKVENAYFYVAWLLSSLLLTVSSAVAGNLLADLSYEDEAMGKKMRRASGLIAGLLLPAVLVIAVFGRKILAVFGPTYVLHSYGLLLLFVIVAIPDAVTNVYVTVLRVQGRPQRAAVMNVLIAVVALPGGWWLMGLIGVAGAAWAWAMAQAVGCLYVAADLYLTRRSRPAGRVKLDDAAESFALFAGGSGREQE